VRGRHLLCWVPYKELSSITEQPVLGNLVLGFASRENLVLGFWNVASSSTKGGDSLLIIRSNGGDSNANTRTHIRPTEWITVKFFPGPRQHSQSFFRVSRDSWSYLTLWRLSKSCNSPVHSQSKNNWSQYSHKLTWDRVLSLGDNRRMYNKNYDNTWPDLKIRYKRKWIINGTNQINN
jgi:hypothetical protein